MQLSDPGPRLDQPGHIRVGCCGWPQARARYFTHFPVVELQDPFYEMPGPSLAAKWRDAAPLGFQFCIKAWQLITHTPASPTYRRLKSQVSPSERDLFGSFRPTDQVWLAWERTCAIARILEAAVILFQCPGSFLPTPENIRNFRVFFGRVDRGNSVLAWEPRGPWPDRLVAELCAEFDLLHCVDPFQGESQSGGTVYWRLHGHGRYRHVYADSELAWLKNRTLRSVAEKRPSIYVLFNNMSMGRDAIRFQQMLNIAGIGQESGSR